MSYNSGLVKADISGSTADNQPAKGSIVKWIYTGTATFTVGAGKKWIVTSMWCLSKTATTSKITLSNTDGTDREILQTGAANQNASISGNPVFELVATDDIILVVSSGSAGFTYYEVNA